MNCVASPPSQQKFDRQERCLLHHAIRVSVAASNCVVSASSCVSTARIETKSNQAASQRLGYELSALVCERFLNVGPRREFAGIRELPRLKPQSALTFALDG